MAGIGEEVDISSVHPDMGEIVDISSVKDIKKEIPRSFFSTMRNDPSGLSQVPKSMQLALQAMGYGYGLTKTAAANALKRLSTVSSETPLGVPLPEERFTDALKGRAVDAQTLGKDIFPEDSKILKTTADVFPSIQRGGSFDIAPLNVLETFAGNRLDPLNKLKSLSGVEGPISKVGQQKGKEFFKSALTEADAKALEMGKELAPSDVAWKYRVMLDKNPEKLKTLTRDLPKELIRERAPIFEKAKSVEFDPSGAFKNTDEYIAHLRGLRDDAADAAANAIESQKNKILNRFSPKEEIPAKPNFDVDWVTTKPAEKLPGGTKAIVRKQIWSEPIKDIDVTPYGSGLTKIGSKVEPKLKNPGDAFQWDETGLMREPRTGVYPYVIEHTNTPVTTYSTPDTVIKPVSGTRFTEKRIQADPISGRVTGYDPYTGARIISPEENQLRIYSLPETPAVPGQKGANIKQVSAKKSSTWLDVGDKNFSALNQNPYGKQGQKLIGADLKNAAENMANRAEEGLGEKLGQINNEAGSLLTSRKVFNKDYMKELRKNKFTQVDAMIAAGLGLPALLSMGNSREGILAAIASAGAGLGAKRAVKYLNNPENRMQAGISLARKAESPYLDNMVRRSIWNSLNNGDTNE